MLAQMGKRALGAFAATVGVLVACGLVLGFLEGRATGYLYSVLGWTGIVITGLVGTPVHELGHYLMCKLFGFQVFEVALFRPIAGRADGVLGYVRYSYDPTSLWQRLGCFFVGIAPMVLGVVVILLVLRLLTPEVFRKERLRGWGILRGVLCLYLVFSVSTHMTLSTADLQGALPGLLVVALLCLLFGVVSTLLKVEVEGALKQTAKTVAAFFGVGIAFAGAGMLLFGLLSLIF